MSAVRTWVAGESKMASVDVEPSIVGVNLALETGWIRWPELRPRMGLLLAAPEHMEAARALVPGWEPREVEGLPDGWAVAW